MHTARKGVGAQLLPSTMRSSARGRAWPLGLAAVSLTVVLSSLIVVLASDDGTGTTTWRAPRDLARHLQQRAEGHARPVGTTVAWLVDFLLRLDRGSDYGLPLQNPTGIGAQRGAAWHDTDASTATRARPLRRTTVATSAGLSDAIATALPGTEIVLAPGNYLVTEPLRSAAAGRADAPIVLKAMRLGDATLQVSSSVGLGISHPHWRVENLVFQGRCDTDDRCEHALHVVGEAHHTWIRHNLFEDFNAAIKANPVEGKAPDHGWISLNTVRNTRARRADKPTVGLDLVAIGHWRIDNNLIADLVNADPRITSYGMYAKGGAVQTRIVGNTVLCEQALRGFTGSRVGISLGGGGTGTAHCRAGERCRTGESIDGWVVNNLIGSCSDVGISLLQAHQSVVLHNTLIDTAGLQVRGGLTTGEVRSNLLDGPLRWGDSVALQHGHNRGRPPWSAYLGLRWGLPTWKHGEFAPQSWPLPDLQVPLNPKARSDWCQRPRGTETTPGAVDKKMGEQPCSHPPQLPLTQKSS